MPEQASNPYARPEEAIKEPPTGFSQTLRFLGPSFILIGSIVGSGELVLTTSFGATVGFAGLWYILLACVVKTIVQSELGRYTISSGDTALQAFNRVPGPRFRASWMVWFWVLWQIPGLFVGGAILGSTGQILSVAWPVMTQEQWAGVIAFVNVLILLWGRYSLLEKASLFMVISFSVITLIGAVALQFSANAVPLEEALMGLRVQLAPLMATTALSMAVSSFAGTGVSAGELLGYTYWCVEKGYARYAGEADGTEAWTRRAKGWIRVMQIDVWLATVIFTTTTLAFFWLGAGVLHRQGLKPTDAEMISTLQNIYTGSLGPWAAGLFLLGGFFVLYSTIFSGTAGSSRMWADALGVMGFVKFEDFRNRVKWIRIFTVLVPLIQTSTFLMHRAPQTALVFSSIFVGMQIPIIAAVAIWLRYRRTDKTIRPTLWTDVPLWICTLIIASVTIIYFVVIGPTLPAKLGWK